MKTGKQFCISVSFAWNILNLPKFSPPQMSIWVSYFPRWLNQDLSITKMPPAMTGVLEEKTEIQKK